MLVGAIGTLVFIVMTPHPRKLELPAGVHIESSKRNTYMRDVCIEGVLYSKSFGLPEAAVVDAKGKARQCEGGHPTFAGLEARYRFVCRDGIEYVQMSAHRSDSMFVRYDTDLLFPRHCGE